MNDDIADMEHRYAGRSRFKNRYGEFRPDVVENRVERWRELVFLLKSVGIDDLRALDILEIGAGTGGRLLELILLGAQPAHVSCNELIPSRLAIAKERLPQSVRFVEGDASSLPLPDSSQDIVYQSTVFSSVLDNDLREKLAREMWRLVRPGGGVLWYDFVYNNPANEHVRKVPLRQLRALFPDGNFTVRKVTLAPPIARRVSKIHPVFYRLFRTMPFLRTHLLCYVKKSEI